MTAPPLPSVSVVMPVRNEAAFIERALRSVLSQDYPQSRLEVIVADGMSDDGTPDIVRALSSNHSNLRLVENTRHTAAAGLNAGLRQATGEIIVRVDGHCEIAPDYISRCVGHLLSGDADGVGGPIETVGQTPSARAIATAVSSRFGVGNSAFRTRQGVSEFVDTVAFPAYHRSVIDRAGPFDEELVRNQDDEYNYRLRKSGARILLAEDVRSRYHSRSSFMSLWRQYLQYGFWKVRVMQKHPRQMRPRQFVPPLFVFGLLVLAAAASVSGLAAKGLALVAVAYLAANVGAAVLSTSRDPWLAPRVALAFAILHVSYGLGLLFGLVRFANRWGEADDQRAPELQAMVPEPKRPHQTERHG